MIPIPASGALLMPLGEQDGPVDMILSGLAVADTGLGQRPDAAPYILDRRRGGQDT